MPVRPSPFRLFRRARVASAAEGANGTESTAQGLRVTTGFEGGNASEVEIVAPAHVRFSAQAHRSPRPLWFAFCLEDAEAPSVRCDLVNADACLGPRRGWKTARPVFSPDGRTWRRVARARYVEESAVSGYFRFEVPVVSSRTYVAFSYPYSTADLALLLSELGGADAVRVEELCRSAEGRPVPLVTFGDPGLARRSVWILARQHAGEAPGSHAAEGLARAFAACPPEDGLAVYLAPMLDVDGVAHGRYGKDQSPVDYNRDWRSGPTFPEVAALLSRMRAAQAAAPAALVLDLHAPHAGDDSCYLFAQPFTAGSPTDRFVRALEAASPARVGFRRRDVRTDPGPARSARAFLQAELRAPALTVEVSYHLAQSGLYLEPEDYRQFGAALAEAAREAARESSR